MKKYIVFFLTVILVSIGCAKDNDVKTEKSKSETKTSETKKKENPAPDFTLEDTNNKEVSLKDFKDKKVVLIVFWTTWCKYCVTEIPELKKLKEELEGKDIEILAIDVKEDKEKVVSFIEKKKINYTVLLDKNGKTASKYKVIGFPTSAVIDKKGNLVYFDFPLPENTKEYLENLLK